MESDKIDDGGIWSRKVLGAIMTQWLIVGSWVASHWLGSIETNFGTVVSGVVGTYALFVGANISGKYVLGKAINKASELENDSSEVVQEESEKPINKK